MATYGDKRIALKFPVRACSTTNITLSGAQTIDGVSVVADDDVLVGGQTAPAENGIYTASATAWARRDDCDTDDKCASGIMVMIKEGTANADDLYMLTTDAAITVGTTSLTFAKTGLDAGGAQAAIEALTTLQFDAAASITTASGDLTLNPTGDISLGNNDVGGVGDISAGGGDTFTILCETGQDAHLAASTGNKVSFNQTGVAFYGSATVAQPSSTGETTGWTSGGGANAVMDASTFTGNSGSTAYTIGDIVKHLKALGLIAA